MSTTFECFACENHIKKWWCTSDPLNLAIDGIHFCEHCNQGYPIDEDYRNTAIKLILKKLNITFEDIERVLYD